MSGKLLARLPRLSFVNAVNIARHGDVVSSHTMLGEPIGHVGEHNIYEGCGGTKSEHHYISYVCAAHCDCKDHYYRVRDCKHVSAFLDAYDALREDEAA